MYLLEKSLFRFVAREVNRVLFGYHLHVFGLPAILVGTSCPALLQTLAYFHFTSPATAERGVFLPEENFRAEVYWGRGARASEYM